ncbi:hypothetical protein ABIE26_001185 [Pedobacter africanus]|uniref:Uncharacterized protein n=1 Tax=Pedobacter africanus TaxID=151894 RepID=A0ACC6KT11_9SPHI|nr:hypothetical protein [Pedobacter africanus]MDR6782327.1 hypothetical protein [Pedobacter africanus]
MASLDGKFIKGTAGSVVYKKYRNKQIVTSKPEFSPGSQTEATKLAAASFGLAVKLAKHIRHNLDPVVTEFFDGPMVNRFNSELIYVLNQVFDPETEVFTFNTESFSRLAGFEFNMDSPVRDNFFVQPEATVSSTTLKIEIPEIHQPHELKFPKDGRKCVLGLAVGMYDLKHGRMTLSPIQSTTIDWTYDPMVVPPKTFEFEIEPGCLCIPVISMQFVRTTFAGTIVVNNKSFNPVAILRAFIAAGEPEKSRTKSWQSMDFKTGE